MFISVNDLLQICGVRSKLIFPVMCIGVVTVLVATLCSYWSRSFCSEGNWYILRYHLFQRVNYVVDLYGDLDAAFFHSAYRILLSIATITSCLIRPSRL